MNNLRSLIKSFFHEACPVEEIRSLREGFFSMNTTETLFTVKKTRGLIDFINYSENELESLDIKFKQDWQYIPNKNESFPKSKFNTLIHFTDQVLVEEDSEPFVVYHNLLKWKDLSIHLGEDILTTSFFAFRDLKSNKNRSFFSWKPYLFTNNKRLKSILKQGIAENHSHLYASGLNFDFSWIALMNNYDKLKSTLADFTNGERKHVKVSHNFRNQDIDYQDLIEYSVDIRLLLFYCIEYFKDGNKTNLIGYLDDKLDLNNLLLQIFQSENTLEKKIISKKIKEEINFINKFSALKLKNKSQAECFDYLIPKGIPEVNNDHFYYLYGERKLLYDCFRIIFSFNNDSSCKIIFEKLFYIYLLIKNDFRKELIQINGRYGFENFKKYQDDKFKFLEKNTIKTSIYINSYFEVVFNLYPKQMNLVSNEFRISPPKNVHNFKKNIEYFNSIIDKETVNKTSENLECDPFYVIHFFKKNEEVSNNILSEINCRHAKLRKDLRKQAFDIVNLRENHPEIASKIKGIDAASSEFSTRPEVFGQVFRYLRNHYLREDNFLFKKTTINKLRLTFHAGEDFFDVADGLRYIDESIKFLGMCDGDRLGHALALGISIDYYYELKNKTILLPKQVLLDNVTWVINKAKKFGLLSIHISAVQQLESLFNSLASEVYINPILEKYSSYENLNENLSVFRNINYNHQLFHDAWKLRGDNPEEYKHYFSDNLSKINNNALRYWDRCAINCSSYKYDLLRQRKDVCFIYHEYHYNDFLKKKGEEIKQFRITEGYIRLINDIQNKMLGYVSSRNIAIECNPSSNYLIGTVDKYIQHPIFKFNSKGLNFSDNFDSPLLSVSVNTDDAGIFHTSLENEYALLAIALEKEKDENGSPKFKPNDIYDWIDHVRKMGIHQSFKG